jgi:hypothetical protein
MIRLPAGRLFTLPMPPSDFAARDFAAVILPPLLFFAILILSILLFCLSFEIQKAKILISISAKKAKNQPAHHLTFVPAGYFHSLQAHPLLAVTALAARIALLRSVSYILVAVFFPSILSTFNNFSVVINTK